MDAKAFLSISSVARIIAAILLALALKGQEYGFYTLLRWVVCAVGVYCGILAYRAEKTSWIWGFGIITVLFNPIAPIHFSRANWMIIDVVTAVAFLTSIQFVHEQKIDKN